jgi:hypothetical protein
MGAVALLIVGLLILAVVGLLVPGTLGGPILPQYQALPSPS